MHRFNLLLAKTAFFLVLSNSFISCLVCCGGVFACLFVWAFSGSVVIFAVFLMMCFSSATPAFPSACIVLAH